MWSKVGDGWCQDEDGDSVTRVSACVDASGAAGEAECKAACVQRQPRCVAITYKASGGYCYLHGSKVTGADPCGVSGSYRSFSGSDVITRTDTRISGSRNYICVAYTPGERRASGVLRARQPGGWLVAVATRVASASVRTVAAARALVRRKRCGSVRRAPAAPPRGPHHATAPRPWRFPRPAGVFLLMGSRS